MISDPLTPPSAPHTGTHPATTPSLSRAARLVGHCGFLVMAVMSVLLANERVFYIDSATQLFEMMLNGNFVIFDHRYTMTVTQLLPLLAIKLGLPLPVIVAAYSLAAPLMGWIIYVAIVYGLKEVRLGLLLLLPQLFLCHTFFHAISETFSLAFYATLLLALLRHSPVGGAWRTALHALGVTLATAACVFMHPIGMFYVLFVLGYHWVDRRLRPDVALVVGGVVLVGTALVKLNLGSNHDAEFMPSLPEALHYMRHPDEIKIIGQFFASKGNTYLYPIVLYAIVLVHHIRHREWLRLGFGGAFNAAFIAMTLVVYHEGGNEINVERSFLPLMFFAGVPAMCEAIPAQSVKWQRAWLVLFVALLALAWVKIGSTARPYTQRLDLLEAIAAEGRRQGVRKMVTDTKRTEGMFEVDSWATGFESVLLSSMEGPDSTVSIFIDPAGVRADNPDYHVADAMLGVPWWMLWYYNALPERWFRLPLEEYRLMDFADGQPVFSPLEAN